eukprot:scaffold744_cov170-Chaetoceros_neogracile.AAC.4
MRCLIFVLLLLTEESLAFPLLPFTSTTTTTSITTSIPSSRRSIIPPLLLLHKPNQIHTNINSSTKLSAQEEQDQESQSSSSSASSSSFNRYKTRSAILQHTLTQKKNETKLLRQKLEILQSVIQKLQSSNKNLLDKIQYLHQQAQEGGDDTVGDDNDTVDSTVGTDKNNTEIWPPDMQAQLNKDEYEMKERQWKKAFRMAQLKYAALKEESREWEKEVHEREADVLFYKDRALVDESEILLLREQIGDLQCRSIDGVGDSDGDGVDKDSIDGNSIDGNSIDNDGDGGEVNSIDGDNIDDNSVDDNSIDDNSIDNDGDGGDSIDGNSIDNEINVQDEEKANKIQNETEKANQLLLLENQIDSLQQLNALAQQQSQQQTIQGNEQREELQREIKLKNDRIQALQKELVEIQEQQGILVEQRNGAVGEMEMLRNSTEAASLVQLEMELRDVAIAAAAAAADANRESLEIATAAVQQAEARSEGLQMELNRTLRELKDSRTGFGKDRELIATLRRDGRKQVQMGGRIDGLQLELQAANDRYGEAMRNVTSLNDALMKERRLVVERSEAERMERKQSIQNEDALEIATGAVLQGEVRSEGLQLKLNRTLQELDDARAERVSDKKQIADLQEDVQRQQQQQQQQAEVAMRSEEKEVKVMGDRIEDLQQNDQFANDRGEEMGQNNVTSLPNELINELEILEDGIEAEPSEEEQISLDLLTEVDNIVLQDSSVAAELNGISSEIQMQISTVPPKEKRLNRLARRHHDCPLRPFHGNARHSLYPSRKRDNIGKSDNCINYFESDTVEEDRVQETIDGELSIGTHYLEY